MLRMSLKKRSLVKAIVLAALVECAHVPTLAKCASLEVTVKGEIEGTATGLNVLVEISSDTPGDAITDSRQTVSLQGSQFRVVASFNTTSNLVSAETCDRKPHSITVKLMRGDQVLDRQVLSIEKDFRRTKKGGYDLARPLILHAP